MSKFLDVIFIFEKLICSVDLLYAEIDNRVGKVNQDFDYIIRQSTSNGKVMQTLPLRDPVYYYDNKIDCDNVIKNAINATILPPTFPTYNSSGYTLYYVFPQLSGGHTIFFEDTGKREAPNVVNRQLDDQELEQAFMYSQQQFHLNLQGLMESYYEMITGAVRLGVVWGNASFNTVDVYPGLPDNQRCFALLQASNGFGDMFPILTSDRFLEGRINKFYFDTMLSMTLVDYAFPNYFDGYNVSDRFSVSQVTFSPYMFLDKNLKEDDSSGEKVTTGEEESTDADTNSREIYYFVTDNCTGLIVGMNNDTMDFLLETRNLSEAHYISDMKHGFDKIFETFFYHGVNISQYCEQHNEKRAVRDNTVITTDEGEDYFVTYYDSRGLVKYLYWAIYKNKHLGETHWEVDKNILHFTYSSKNKTSSDTVCFNNTGSKNIDWILNAESTVGITTNIQSGTIKPGGKQCITASINVTKRIQEDYNSVAYYLSITPSIDLSTCYKSFVLTADYDIKDCTSDDVIAYIDGSKNFDLIVKYKWREPHTCYDGIELPKEYKHKGHSLSDVSVGLQVLCYIFLAILLIENITYLVLIYLRPVNTRSISPPIYFVVYIVGSTMCGITYPVAFTNQPCFAIYTCTSAGLLFITAGFFLITYDIYKKHEKRQFSSKGEGMFTFRIIVVICILFGVTLYMSYPYHFTSSVNAQGYEIPVEVCGSDDTITQIGMYLVDFLFSLIAAAMAYHLISNGMKELPPSAKKELIVTFINTLITVVVFVIRLITTGSYPSAVLSFATFIIMNIWAIFLLFFVLPPSQFYQIKSNTNSGGDLKNLLFDDPIIRACLKLYLKDILQEEGIVFWEDACKFQKNFNKHSREENEAEANRLYNGYIISGSENEIPISDTAREKIKVAIESRAIPSALFEEAIGEMQKYILDNNSYLFTQSRYGLLSENVNMWFSEFNNFDIEIKQAIEEQIGILLHESDNKLKFRSTVVQVRSRAPSSVASSKITPLPI